MPVWFLKNRSVVAGAGPPPSSAACFPVSHWVHEGETGRTACCPGADPRPQARGRIPDAGHLAHNRSSVCTSGPPIRELRLVSLYPSLTWGDLAVMVAGVGGQCGLLVFAPQSPNQTFLGQHGFGNDRPLLLTAWAPWLWGEPRVDSSFSEVTALKEASRWCALGLVCKLGEVPREGDV